MEDWIIPTIAVALVVVGLVGQGFELKKIKISKTRDEEIGSPSIFLDKKNYKWYAIIGTGIALWYATGGFP